MKSVSLAAIALISFISSYAQQPDSLDKNAIKELLFSSPHLSFSITPFLPPVFTITNTSDQYIYTPVKFIGFEAGIHYRINLGNNYTIVTGVNAGVSKRGFHFFISKEKFTPTLWSDMDIKRSDMTNRTNHFISIPATIEKQWETKKGNYWHLLTGISLRYYTAEKSLATWRTQDESFSPYAILFLEHEMIKNNTKKLLPGLNTGAGYSILLKNHDLLRLNLNANLSPAKLIVANYKVPISNQEPLTGTYTLHTSYVGLGVEYIFTGARKKIRDMLE